MKIILYITMMGSLVVCGYANDKLKSVKNKELPRLVDFGAHQCLACKKMEPVLASLKKKYSAKLKVEFVDVWKPENKEIAIKNKIRLIPTQIFFDAKGNELWRHEGFISEKDIVQKWAKLGVDLK